MILFLGLSVVAIMLSFVLIKLGFTATHPVTQKLCVLVNFLSVNRLQMMISNAVANFSASPPMGIVLAAMLALDLVKNLIYFSYFLETLLQTSKVQVQMEKVIRNDL